MLKRLMPLWIVSSPIESWLDSVPCANARNTAWGAAIKPATVLPYPGKRAQQQPERLLLRSLPVPLYGASWRALTFLGQFWPRIYGLVLPFKRGNSNNRFHSSENILWARKSLTQFYKWKSQGTEIELEITQESDSWQTSRFWRSDSSVSGSLRLPMSLYQDVRLLTSCQNSLTSVSCGQIILYPRQPLAFSLVRWMAWKTFPARQ